MYRLSGFLSYRPVGASFLIPTFSSEHSNQTFVHDLNERGKVETFSAIEPANYFPVENKCAIEDCEIGSDGVFAARLKNNGIICGHFDAFAEALSKLNLEEVGSPFFNVDAYLLLNNFRARMEAIAKASKLFRNSEAGRIWAECEKSIKVGGLLPPRLHSEVQKMNHDRVFDAVQNSKELKAAIEGQIWRLLRLHVYPGDRLPEGAAKSAKVVKVNSIRVTSVNLTPKSTDHFSGTFQFTSNLQVEVQIQAEDGSAKTVSFSADQGSHARLAVVVGQTPNDLKVEMLDLTEYVLSLKYLLRMRTSAVA